MMFASKTPHDLNHDPVPFVRTYNGTEPTRISAEYAAQTEARFENGFGEIVVTRHDPLPEFDHVQHNQPNPILLAVRAERDRAWTFLHSSVGGNICRYPDATGEQMTHAHRVLSRLARMGDS